ncbi:hypothetical protein [Pseudomonas sp. 25 R 14]|nr:hypothetical protein [Pseudomonas sp. 25 R 14]
MQLIQQCFKFVIGDVGADRLGRLHSRRRCRHSVRGKLALAVQLIEQRLELGIGNVFAGRHHGWRSRCRCFCLRLDGIEGVQQLFEFAVGNVRLGHRFRRGFNHRGGIQGSRLCQARQGGQQFRGGGGNRCAFAHFIEHAVDRVQGFKDHVHQFRINVPLTLAQDVEHVFGDVAALHQLMELEEAGAPFYSVKTAKNCIEQVRIIRSAFQLDQLLGQLL